MYCGQCTVCINEDNIKKDKNIFIYICILVVSIYLFMSDQKSLRKAVLIEHNSHYVLFEWTFMAGQH